MDPFSKLLLDAFIAAAASLAGGIGEAAGDDTWRGLMTKLAGWTKAEERARDQAFDRAVQRALANFRKAHPNAAAERALALLGQDRADLAILRRLAVEELVLSARPNLGRLLDRYRRDLRFVAMLRGEQLPPWSELEPALRLFLGVLLPQALAEQRELRPLLLEQAELTALDEARSTARSTADSAATLRRIEALLEELIALPRISQNITVAEGGSTSQAPQIIVLGNYYAAAAQPAPDVDALFRRYQTFLVETFGMLDFRGIMQVQNVVSLRLEEVYVPLKDRSNARALQMSLPSSTNVPETIPPDPAALIERLRRQRQTREVREPDHTDLHIFVRDSPFLVVLGDPGAGKSTLVRYVMLALAEGRARERLELEDEWLPILFPVAAFAEARGDPGKRDFAPLDYLSDYYKGLSQPDYGPLFQRALLAGRALVLFDGLDEVREGRLGLVRCLEAFIREWDAPGNRFLATSRIAGYDEAPLDERLFVQTTVRPFDDEDICLFAYKWSNAYERAGARDLHLDVQAAEVELRRRAEARAASLSAAIFANPNVTDLARNPLLLTILALIHQQGARLPDRRVDLYRLCVEALAETWNRARSLSGRPIDVYLGADKLDERFVVNLLGPAALWVHAEQPGGLVEQGDLVRQLTKTWVQTYGEQHGRAQHLAEDFIDLVRRHTGLLQERGHRRYGFLHLTFEEYLAARALLESVMVPDPDMLIHERAGDPSWREVLRLAVASATLRESERLVLRLLNAPTTTENRGRPVILAAECLLDIGRSGASQRAWNAVVERLVEVLNDFQVSFSTRVEGGHVLGRLGDPRLLNPATGDAPGGGYWCQVEAGPFWHGDGPEKVLQQVTLPHAFQIARFPVTNAEYKHFIDDDGYNVTQPWWTEHGRAFLAPGRRPWGDQEQPITMPRYWHDSRYNSPSQPIVGVSWYEAVAYCAWLTLKGHQARWLPIDREIRLPTWLEWERAARHTDQRRYICGNDVPSVKRANNDKTSLNGPAPIGCFLSGRASCGALDMAGNVTEWTATHYQKPLATRAEKDFAARDGVILSYNGFWTREEHLYNIARGWNHPYLRYDYRGIRIVRT